MIMFAVSVDNCYIIPHLDYFVVIYFNEIEKIDHQGDRVGDYNLQNIIEATISKTENLDIGKLKRNF